MSRREIKIDVWKYIRPILMGLGAVFEEKLNNNDCALRLEKTYNEIYLTRKSMMYQSITLCTRPADGFDVEYDTFSVTIGSGRRASVSF